ncbi:hypothetical protein C8J57DRAFT_1367288, partial [Mycena rebaudengoi]
MHASTHYHSNSNSTTSSVRTRSEEADTEEDPVAPITPLPTTTRFDLSRGPKGTAGLPFPEEEDGFVDVDAGRVDNIEDDWVGPVPPLVAAPAAAKKSKSVSGKGKEQKEKEKEKRSKTKKAEAVPVPSVQYPFPVSVEDGASGGGQQHRARRRRAAARGSACIPRARGAGGARRAGA